MKITGAAIRKFRKQHGVDQNSFWSLFGVTQSGGSRYESGRPMPKPTTALITAAMEQDRPQAITNKTLRHAAIKIADWRAIRRG